MGDNSNGIEKSIENSMEKLGEIEIEKVSGGSLEHADGGFRVFNSATGEDFGIFKDYHEAVEVAKKNKISKMGTWGNDEVPFGLMGTGLTREDVRLREDRKHEANKVFGTGSFK